MRIDDKTRDLHDTPDLLIDRIQHSSRHSCKDVKVHIFFESLMLRSSELSGIQSVAADLGGGTDVFVVHTGTYVGQQRIAILCLKNIAICERSTAQ